MGRLCLDRGPTEEAALCTASPAVDNITTILIFAAIFLKLRNARGSMGNCAATESRYVVRALFWINANNVAAGMGLARTEVYLLILDIKYAPFYPVGVA